MDTNIELIKVSSDSNVNKVAGAIAKCLRSSGNTAERKPVMVQAVGQGAVNQAVKSICVTGHYVQEDNIDVIVRAEFVFIRTDGRDGEITAIRFLISDGSINP
jgi:stage V sporulation protein S